MVPIYAVAMQKMAEVHQEVLGDAVLVAKHADTRSYWQEIVSYCITSAFFLSLMQLLYATANLTPTLTLFQPAVVV